MGETVRSCCTTPSQAGTAQGSRMTQLVEDQADELAFLWNETSGK